jgi:WhiB family redox-sensing transcriptional regulator
VQHDHHNPACRNHPDLDPEDWFPNELTGFKSKLNDDNIAALNVCRNECPAMSQCLTVALQSNQQFGIWGGSTANDRRSMRRKGTKLTRVQ